jgi:hypothetical protein
MERQTTMGKITVVMAGVGRDTPVSTPRYSDWRGRVELRALSAAPKIGMLPRWAAPARVDQDILAIPQHRVAG